MLEDGNLRGYYPHVVRVLEGAHVAASGVLSGNDPLGESLGLFLVQTVIILSICRALGILGVYLKQPKVIFEIIGGILLGPSAIGRNAKYMSRIFPKSSLPLLSIVANIGLVLYLFVVGMELDPQLLMTHARRAGGIAFIGMAVPFALGVGISGTMFSVLQGSDPLYKDVSSTSFFVFIGTALSITAFPVLARILKEGGLIYTVPGSMAMGAAALNDAAAWCLLILAISIANAGNMGVAGLVFLSVVAFALGLFFIVRPVWWRLIAYIENMHSPALNNSLFCLALILVFLCSWTTDLLGVHAIFGSFLFGLIMPRDSHLFKECNDKIEELILTLTLPLYFALSGLQTDVTMISTGEQGAMVILVTAMATVGKLLGAGGMALATGLSFRESSVIAVLMNTRGLVELIVLNLGMQSGILSVRTFSVMVIMCLVTTFMTCPIVECIYPPRLRVTTKAVEDAAAVSLLDPEAGDKPASDADDVPSAPENIESLTMERVAKSARLTLVVDRMEHLQGMMELLSCLVPFNRDSSLCVMAIRAHEPSLTEKDEFIGLNADGRLIEVEKESTFLIETHATGPGAVMSRMVKQDLLPLTMFLQAMGATAAALRMRGDPNEFPREVRTIATRSKSNLVFFPWRASSYVERFFWGTVRLSVVPVALVVQIKTVLSTTTADIASSPATPATGIMQRVRSESNANEDNPYVRTRSASRPPRQRVNSRDRADSDVPTLDEGVDADTSNDARIIHSVVAVITGSPMDLAIFPLVLRIAERSSVAITVIIPSDRRSYKEPLRLALEQFRRVAERFQNVTFEHLTTPSNDIESIKQQWTFGGRMFDLAIIGFPAMAITIDAVDHSRLARSSSMFMMPEPDDADLRRLAGVPEPLVTSNLEHPELGPLGSMIYDAELATYLIVVHEPQAQTVTTRGRRNTFGGYLLSDPALADRQGLPEDHIPPASDSEGSASASAGGTSATAPVAKRLFGKKDAELYPIKESDSQENDDSATEGEAEIRPFELSDAYPDAGMDAVSGARTAVHTKPGVHFSPDTSNKDLPDVKEAAAVEEEEEGAENQEERKESITMDAVQTSPSNTSDSVHSTN